jgi:hypothetical protein
MKNWPIADSDRSHQKNQEELEPITESEWDQLQALEELCRQQRERGTPFRSHSHSNAMDFNTFEDHNKATPDDTDFESHSEDIKFHAFEGHDKATSDDTDFKYITAILESFTGFKTMQPQRNQRINQNFAAKKFHHDAAPHTCKARQAMPSKVNYKSIIKTSEPQKLRFNL